MIYEHYSEPFFGGDYRVLRGGSWAVESGIVRPSFRNWDHPYPSADLLRCPAGMVRRRRPGGPPLMCRHLGWLGRETSVSSLVLDPPQGLRVQSYAPRRQKHGLMNADGWGVGFFDGATPRRWRSAAPLWGDVSFDSIAPALRSTAWSPRCVRLLSVCLSKPARRRRSPTASGCLSHNGVVDRDVLPAGSAAESTCDSAVLAALDLRARPRRIRSDHR